ncbi:phosphate signaling complex protein PhoU [Methanobacterium alcaliphilum]|uniref:phosphate signaling complex protein PhoU n=1 Tax=Methanobacterium alcaliphilum TaxID=392018 RepID=UPI00200B3283|nr:phosphate signaling complex protein PhoU [Methanobacterium alcaliphilum]MCK9152156.1 phosphate signaling complex protein PhoU [Methanobacterium alcaliphilum]
MEKRYPRILFRKRLKDLRKEVEDVGQRTIQAHKNAVTTFMDYDEKLAEEIIKDSKEIDELVFNLERKCISIIAAEQPVARDLRFIEACIKVGSHLKRIAYLSANIAEASRNLKDEEIPKKPKEDLKHMADFVQMMLSKGIYAFLDQNMDMAKELRHDDDKVDDLFDQALEHITGSMFDDKEAIYYLINLLFVARFLERVGDRAVSIGDRTIFMITCEKP